MKSEKIWLLILILAFHLSSSEASHDDDDDEVRILVVGVRGQSRLIAADLLSGRKDGGQEDRETVKTPVITDKAGRMMLVTGPNLCEEDTERQTFTTALFLSSPGPHAVLMVLDLEDQQSQQCDIEKRTQELLGAEVLQYCIVLLLQNHQEPFIGASRGMINACGGRFHVIRDSEPKPAQRAALIVEINKAVWLNDHRFYSVLTQELETSQDVHEENPHLSLIQCTLGVGIVGTFFLVLLWTKENYKNFIFGKAFIVLSLCLVCLRHVLNPDLSIPLNLALSVATVLTVILEYIDQFEFEMTYLGARSVLIKIILYFMLPDIILPRFMLIMGSALVFGTIISVRTWSDVLTACYTAPGVTIGAFAFLIYTKLLKRKFVYILGSFLFCAIGETLSVGFVSVFGGMMAIILLILGLTITYFHSNEMLKFIVRLTVIILFFSCVCVLIGSVILSVLWLIVNILYQSYNLLNAALLLGC